jgi:hypothetical protein
MSLNSPKNHGSLNSYQTKPDLPGPADIFEVAMEEKKLSGLKNMSGNSNKNLGILVKPKRAITGCDGKKNKGFFKK